MGKAVKKKGASIEKTLDEIERFFERAAQVDGIETSASDKLRPASDAAIDALAKKFQLTVPDDVRHFWRRGLAYKHLSFDQGDASAFAGFDWYNLKYLARDIPENRKLAELYEAGTHERRLLEKGFPLSYSQPQIAWDPRGGIVHFSTRNDFDPPFIDSFAAFLEHWLEAGCFSSHEIGIWLPKVKHLVPGRIPPAKNVWIKYYKKAFNL
jgi:hypothetical protein